MFIKFPACLRPVILGLLLGSTAQAQGLFGLSAQDLSAQLRLPPDYFGRFGGLSTLGELDHWGVRGFPLPLDQDVRLTLVRHPGYSEFGLQTRVQDTTLTLGSFENTDGAPAYGVSRLEAIHDPASGVQLGVAIRGAGRVSTFSLGYAKAFGPARALAEVGYAVQGGLRSPYAHLEVGAVAARSFGPLSLVLVQTARAFVFPEGTQVSADLAGNLTWRPDPALTFSLSHFERVVGGPATLSGLALGRERRSNLDLVYAPPGLGGPVNLAGLEYHFERYWYDPRPSRNELSGTLRLDFGAVFLKLSPRYDFSLRELGLRSALLYRVGGFALGPLVEYVRTPDRARWSFGVAFAGS